MNRFIILTRTKMKLMEETPIPESVDVDNVYIYLSDALRWSALPNSVQQMGATFKTVSSATATMRAVSSLLTGQNPPRHGVALWSDQLTEQTLLDLPNHSTGFYNDAADRGGLSNILNRENEDIIAEIETPFVYFERERGAHAPYDGLTYDEMITEIPQEQSTLREYYQREINNSIDRFKNRISLLDDRGILSNTLVIFLGDHGELLGESGHVSHSTPPLPELVYTPTIFIHPDLENGRRLHTIGQIDIAPTIIDALGVDNETFNFDGISLFTNAPGPRYNDALHRREILGREIVVYESFGLWDGDGGHRFTTSGKCLAPIIGWRKALGWNRAYWRRNPTKIPAALWSLAIPYRKYGTPRFSKESGRKMAEEIRNNSGSAKRSPLTDEAEEQLRDLGYRT
jgi:hypothetical protein